MGPWPENDAEPAIEARELRLLGVSDVASVRVGTG